MSNRKRKRIVTLRRRQRRIKFRSIWQYSKGVVAFAEKVQREINNAT